MSARELLLYPLRMRTDLNATPKTKPWTLFERRVRITTGLILVAYVVPHLFNHMLGLVSFEAMEVMRPYLAAFWQWTPIWWVLPVVLLVHPVFALMAICRRSTLRMPAAELSQILLGLCVPVLLMGHFVTTRVVRWVTDVDTNYSYVLATIASADYRVVMQSLLVVAVWGHACVGLHMWLRYRPWYRRLQRVLYPLAVIWPLLALIGFWRAIAEVKTRLADDATRAEIFSEWLNVDAKLRLLFEYLELILIGVLLALVVSAVGLRASWLWRRRHRFGASIRHSCGKHLRVGVGQSILEAVRFAQLNHASMCGGRARCTTCRVEISAGLDTLPEPSPMEAAALSRIQADPHVRLACQTYPTTDVSITPVIDPRFIVTGNELSRGGVAGAERDVVAMFVDLRESTRLAEEKLPYDVVFVLNRFFAEMSEALDDTGGHYAQFAGDGLLALYGLDRDIGSAARAALEGANNMMQRIDKLNDEIASELSKPLRIGIGVHSGEAIVGVMGPPETPIRSAIGDNINIAARLESLTKQFNARMVVSVETVGIAGVDYTHHQLEEVRVRGRKQRLPVYVVT